MHVLAVLSPPGSTTGSTNGLGVTVSLAKTTRALAGRGQATQFTVLVHVLANPVDLRITGDGIVMNIHQDNLKVFVGSVLSNPVGVQNTQSSKSATNALLQMNKSKYSLKTYRKRVFFIIKIQYQTSKEEKAS